MRKVIILGGGNSSEREVSLSTAQTICTALSEAGMKAEIVDPVDYTNWKMVISVIRKKSPDMVFIGLHGAGGENGVLQRMLKHAHIPYTGSDSRASTLAMNKLATLRIAEKAGIPVAERYEADTSDMIRSSKIVSKLGLPVVIKPNSSGSSVGISIVRSEAELEEGIERAAMHDNMIICEKYIGGRELTVTILGKRALPVVEIKPNNGWYDYINKYTDGNTQYICPADLNKEETQTVQKYAEKIYRLLGCKVYGRIDFRYDGEKFYLLEVNTLPGMTALSLTPKAARSAGYDLSGLFLEIIRLSERKNKD